MVVPQSAAAKDIVPPASLRLHPCQAIDCTSLVQAPTASLTRQLYAHSLCFHPERPLLAVGACGVVGVVDLLSGSRLGRIDLGSEPVDMCFAPDAALLIVAVAEWHIHVVSLSTWRSRVLVPRRQKAEKPLEGCLLAVTKDLHPVVYFCKYGKELLRVAYTNEAEAADLKKLKTANWGTKVKLDVVKPVLGLACHPHYALLLLLHADGFIRSYVRQSSEVLVPAYSFQVQDKLPASLPAMGTFQVVSHPHLPSSALILQAERLGGITILETAGQGAPMLLLRSKMAGWVAVLGLGLQQDNSLVLAFGLTEAGKVRSGAWKILGRANEPGAVLVQARVEPVDLTPLLDGLGRAKASTAAAASVLSGGGKAGAAMAWQSLWAPPPSWSTDVSSSVLLDQQLAPLVAKVVVHPLLGVVAALLEPSFVVQTNNALSCQPFGQLLSEELSVAKRTASVPLLALSNAEAYLGGWRGGLASPMHAGLTAWQGQSLLGGQFQFPCHMFYLSGGKIFKFAPAARTASPLVALAADAADGSARVARHLIHSYKQSAWAVQFESLGTTDALKERWQWTLLLPSAFEGAAPAVWSKAGKYPTFVGPNDSHIAVIEPSGKALAVFPVATTASSAAPPTFTISLDSCSISGCASPLFPGPPCVGVPHVALPPPAADAKQTPEEARAEKALRREAAAGAGAIMWQTSDGQLAMTSLPSLIRVSKLADDSSEDGDGDSSDDDEMGAVAARREARAKAQAVMPGGHMGARQRQVALQLLPGERVLQVSWQQLSAVAPTSPDDVAAGVLTTSRILLVDGALRVLASTDVGASACLAYPITSMLWAGPALLYCTIAGQVMQLSWCGTPHPVALVAPGRHLLLVGALPDALLMLRAVDPAGMVWEPVVRPTAVLQPLVLGWAGLAASGLLPSGIYAGRTAMQSLLSKFDIGTLTPGLVWSLITAWAADVAAVLADRSSHLDADTALAAQAAAGKWPAVTAALMGEFERSIHYPRPPPRGSALHAKITAAAAGCVSHGQFVRAIGLLRSAGEWRSAMVVAVCQGSMPGITLAASDAAGSGDPAEAVEARRLEGAFRSLYVSSTTLVPDSTLQLTSSDGNEVPLASTWTLGGLGIAPQAVTVAGPLLPSTLVGPNDAGPVPPTSLGDPLLYLGLGPTATAALVMAKAVRSPLERFPVDAAMGLDATSVRTSASASSTSGAAEAAGTASGSNKRPSLANVSVDSLGLEPPQSDAQAAARADFLREAGIGQPSGELSSDEDLDGDGNSVAAARRFKVQIRSKDEVGTGAAADAAMLKEAAKNLKLSLALPPPPKAVAPVRLSGVSPGAAPAFASGDLLDFSSPKGAFTLSPKGGVSHLSPAFSGSLTQLPPTPTMTRVAPPPPPPGSMAAEKQLQRQQQLETAQRAPSPPLIAPLVSFDQSFDQAFDHLPPPPPVLQPPVAAANSVALYQQGVALMEAADWAGSATAFGQAITVLRSEAPGPSTAQRIAFCAQYYAAVRLLSVAAGSAQKGQREARLYRFVATLKLDDKHQLALAREAIARNRAAGNYRYAGDQLTNMIAKCLDTGAPMEYMAQLQADIDACDRAGGNNVDVPAVEDLDRWAAAVAAAPGLAEVDRVIEPVLRG